jgi:hypothetical protein|tara:strand:- start:2003 stop:2716 length:714 start_codon:yes stop_codon:yes gene_type:complete
LSIIPNKNLFIVTSALRATIGVVNEESRMKQTVESLKNIRSKVPDAIILFVDGSPFEISNDKVQEINTLCDHSIWWQKDADVNHFASQGLKSQAEIIMLSKTLALLKTNPMLMKKMHGVKRIFKFSARSFLLDTFNIRNYDNLYGKYVFKQKLASWMPTEQKESITDHLYITRMYSFCPSLIIDYMETQQKIFNDVQNYRIDTEHAHYKNLNQNYIHEFHNISCAGIVAGTGELETY